MYFLAFGGFGSGAYSLQQGNRMDIENWLTMNVAHTSPRPKDVDIEIPHDRLEEYAEHGKRGIQIKLPGGCYIVTGWYPSMADNRVNVRLGKVPLDKVA